MSDDATDHPEDAGRRLFLKSLFGLGAQVGKGSPAYAARPAGASIFWANLRSGHIGFPTGLTVPSGRPGSVMKLVTAAALRESGFFQGSDTIECRRHVDLDGESFSCLYA